MKIHRESPPSTRSNVQRSPENQTVVPGDLFFAPYQYYIIETVVIVHGLGLASGFPVTRGPLFCGRV